MFEKLLSHGIMRTLNEYKPRAPYEFSETYTWILSECKPRAQHEVSDHGIMISD